LKANGGKEGWGARLKEQLNVRPIGNRAAPDGNRQKLSVHRLTGASASIEKKGSASTETEGPFQISSASGQQVVSTVPGPHLKRNWGQQKSVWLIKSFSSSDFQSTGGNRIYIQYDGTGPREKGCQATDRTRETENL